MTIRIGKNPCEERKDGSRDCDVSMAANEDNIEQVLESNGTTTSKNLNESDNIATPPTSKNDDAQGDDFYASDNNPEVSQQQLKLKHWRESPFAVGVVNPTWWEDRPAWFCSNNEAVRDIDESLSASSIACACIGAGRVGNLAILAQSTEEYVVETIDEETGQVILLKRQRPRLLWVIGPYWTVNFFLTFPLILGASGWVLYRRVLESHVVVIISWSIGTFLLIFSLCMISCRNPGVLHRYAEPPPDTSDWRWNDQAKTYRPPKARFDPETQVIVEGFDHT